MKIKAVWVTLKFILFAFLLILCAVLLHGLDRELETRFTYTVPVTRVIIDPGHGGEDGGAVGINGCVEKEINLEIALILSDLLKMSGIDTAMTRSEDIMLYDSASPGKKKTQDLQNRVRIGEESENSITVSIHMNTYPSEACKGAQVYYSPNHPESKSIAEIIQLNIKNSLQPENQRQTKAAGSAIYLLHNIKTPAVLVECGFISNSEEAQLLCDDSYRHRMAMAIYASIIEYLNKEI